MDTRVDEYILKEIGWKQAIMQNVRRAVHEADPEVTETIKWGAPYFDHAGGVAWMFCAANRVHFSFRQGALLDASHGRFESTDNKAMRTIRFTEQDSVPHDLIVSLVRQAVQNNVEGKKIQLTSPKPGTQVFDVPYEYVTYLQEHGLLDAYKARPYYQQKGWIQWIESAKRSSTKQARMERMLNELEHDQYMPAKKQTAIVDTI